MDPNATAPGVAASVDDDQLAPVLALVILWCAGQPHRVGEVALFPIYEKLYVGRWDEDFGKIEEFARFARRCPGEVLAADPRVDVLTGNSISRGQLIACATAVTIEVESKGRCVMLVNGVETKIASLKPGDRLMLQGELLLMCVRRPAVIPSPPPGTFIPAFGEPDAEGILGVSPSVWAMRAEIARLAESDEDVLIQGESGSGKELAARAIHLRSRRAKGPFVSHNAAAFTDTLIENQLFGNVEDYPNVGTPERKGLVIQADRGTLFLDEIGDLRLEAQAKLLRVMDSDGECRVQGAPKSQRVDVRFIGATNLGDDAFRSDFRHRLPARLPVPPVRERPEDIPLFIRQWVLRHARAGQHGAMRFVYTGPSGRPEARVSARLIEYLVQQPLAGNFRELHGMLLAAAGREGDTLRLPAVGPAKESAPPPAEEAEEEPGEVLATSLTQEQIEACLDRHRGNVKSAATALRVGRSALYRRMDALGIKWKK
jgi:transcriptional regulator with AAA-type ATPase domain